MKSATIQAVLGDAELTAGAQLVLFAIFSHADRDGVCYPSNATLLRHLKGMPEATLNRHLATLERLGRISRDYERQTRRRYITVALSRYTEGAAPITSDRCKSDLHLSNGRSAPIKQAGCTYQTEGSAPITSDRPNKNGSENGSENAPERGARMIAPLTEPEPFETPPPTADEAPKVRGPGPNDRAMRDVIEWANGLGSTAGQFGCPLGDWVKARAYDAPASWFRALLKDKCGPGTRPRRVEWLNSILNDWIKDGKPEEAGTGGGFKVVQKETPFPPYITSWRKAAAQ